MTERFTYSLSFLVGHTSLELFSSQELFCFSHQMGLLCNPLNDVPDDVYMMYQKLEYKLIKKMR